MMLVTGKLCKKTNKQKNRHNNYFKKGNRTSTGLTAEGSVRLCFKRSKGGVTIPFLLQLGYG